MIITGTELEINELLSEIHADKDGDTVRYHGFDIHIVHIDIHPCEYQNKNIAPPSAQPERSVRVQEILDYLDAELHPIVSPRYWDVYSSLYDMISSLSLAQHEIIRCKECKHWFDIDDGRQKHRMCADISGDWFCADAKRRADG